MRLRYVLPLILSCGVTSPLGAAAPSRSAAVEECLREDRVELNLTSWKASLKRAETPKRRDEVLSEVKLSLELGESEGLDRDGRGPAANKVTLLGLDDSLVRLGPGERPDHVIQVRYRLGESDDKAISYLIQVLRPLGSTGWCLLGSNLSRQVDPDAERTLDSYTLDYMALLSAKTKAIEVQRVDAQLRHSETYRQYWVVEGFKLRKVFDAQIGSMESLDDGRATTARIAKLSLVGGFPRRIELHQITKQATCEVGSGDVPCDDSEPSSLTTFVYDGKQFVRRK
jgi:hypothetical protein